MNSGVSRAVRIFLPVIVLLLLGAWPGARQVQLALSTARMARAQQLFGTAAEQLRAAAAAEPFRRGLWEQIGQDELAGGNLSAAVDAFRAAQELADLSSAGLAGLATALEQQGEWLAAAQTWAELDRTDPTAAAPCQRWLSALRKGADFTAAEAAAAVCVRRFPQDSQALYTLALFQAQDHLEEAVGSLEAAARLDSRYQTGLNGLRQAAGLAAQSQGAGYSQTLVGRWLGQAGEWDLAERAFAAAAAAAPDYAEAWAFWGQAKQVNGKDGLPEMEKAIGLNPDAVLPRALLALYWGNLGQYDKAIVQMEAAARLEPKQAAWQLELGTLSAASGDLVLARTYFAAAEALDPDNPLVWDTIARFSAHYGADLRGYGLPAARRLVELQPEDVRAKDLLAVVLLQLGDLRAAERILQQVQVGNAKDPAVHLHLGQVYLQLQDNEQAFQQLKLASELDARGEMGRLARRLLEQYFGAKAQ